MNSQWPKAKLGEVLRYRKEFVTIDDLTLYKRPRVQLHVRGIVQRDEVLGALIKTKTQQICHTGEFLVAEIDAKVGGFGIVPKSLNGSIVSSHYFLFVVDNSKLSLPFLDYFIRTPAFRKQVEAQGSTNYAAIRPAHVLGYEILLPALGEQQRLVTQIDALAAQIHEARTLRQRAAEEAEMLVMARSGELFRLASGKGTVPLERIATLERGRFSYRPRNEPRFFGGAHPWIQIAEVEAAGKFIRQWNATLNDDGLAISKKFPKGTVLVSIAATIGAVGILDFDCCVPDSIVGVTPREGTDTEFLYHYLGYIRGHLEDVAPQSAQKNINLGILSPLPVPKLALSEQRNLVSQLDALQGEVDELKNLQIQTAIEIDALLPGILDRAFNGHI